MTPRQAQTGAAPPVAAAPSTAAQPGIVRVDATSDLWWKNAVVYCVDVTTFLDHDGDGCGDFEGLAGTARRCPTRWSG